MGYNSWGFGVFWGFKMRGKEIIETISLCMYFSAVFKEADKFHVKLLYLLDCKLNLDCY